MSDNRTTVCRTCRGEGRILQYFSRGPDSPPGNQYVGCPDCEKGRAYDVALERERWPQGPMRERRFAVVPTELIGVEAPYARIIHRGAKLNARGDVSALCFKRPRAINLKHASWVLLDKEVTCPRCRALLGGA